MQRGVPVLTGVWLPCLLHVDVHAPRKHHRRHSSSPSLWGAFVSACRHLLITALYISREHFSWGGWLSCFSIWKRLLLSGSSVSPPPLPPLFGSSLFLFGSRILVMLGGSMIESWFRRLFVLRSLKSSQVRLGTQYLPVLKKLFTASPSAYLCNFCW